MSYACEGTFLPFSRQSGKTSVASSREFSYDLERLSSEGMQACAFALEALASGAVCREEAASRIVKHLFNAFRLPDATGERSCALVRCFQTCSLEALPPPRRAFATKRLGSIAPRGNLRCLTLLATRGIEPQWNEVGGSTEHQAIPLPSVEVILRAPMIARLLLQTGIRYEHVIEPPPERPGFLLDDTIDTFKIFHVEQALGSPYIPAQASFVHPHRIRSVLGMGGLLPGGELFAVVLFTRVEVSRENAELFRILARSVKYALMPFTPEQIFAKA
jgi:hypothetical protein